MKGPSRKYYIIKRNDKKFSGSTVDIPEESLFATLRIHPTWEVLEEIGEKGDNPVSITAAPKASLLECPIDGRAFRSERALKIHKKTH